MIMKMSMKNYLLQSSVKFYPSVRKLCQFYQLKMMSSFVKNQVFDGMMMLSRSSAAPAASTPVSHQVPALQAACWNLPRRGSLTMTSSRRRSLTTTPSRRRSLNLTPSPQRRRPTYYNITDVAEEYHDETNVKAEMKLMFQIWTNLSLSMEMNVPLTTSRSVTPATRTNVIQSPELQRRCVPPTTSRSVTLPLRRNVQIFSSPNYSSSCLNPVPTISTMSTGERRD